MEETPKKIAQRESKCFVCKAEVTTKDKIHIFGKSSLDLPELINGCLDVNLEAFSESRQALFLCKSCYRLLQKYKRARDNVVAVKNDVLELYKRAPTRVKRSLRAEEANELVVSKASKALSFPDTPTQFLTPLPAQVNNLTIPGLPSPIAHQHSPGLVLKAFPFLHAGVTPLYNLCLDSLLRLLLQLSTARVT